MKVVWCAATWVVLAASYLLLAGTVDGVEITAAVLCASLATSLVVAVSATSKRHYEARPPVRAIVVPFAHLVPEALAVARALVGVVLGGSDRQLGGFTRQPFDPGQADARSAGRRALAVIGVSLAPRSFVVRGERTQELLLHTFPEAGPSADRAWPL